MNPPAIGLTGDHIAGEGCICVVVEIVVNAIRNVPPSIDVVSEIVDPQVITLRARNRIPPNGESLGITAAI